MAFSGYSRRIYRRPLNKSDRPMADSDQQNVTVRNVRFSRAKVVNSDYPTSSKSFGRGESPNAEDDSEAEDG